MATAKTVFRCTVYIVTDDDIISDGEKGPAICK